MHESHDVCKAWAKGASLGCLRELRDSVHILDTSAVIIRAKRLLSFLRYRYELVRVVRRVWGDARVALTGVTLTTQSIETPTPISPLCIAQPDIAVRLQPCTVLL